MTKAKVNKEVYEKARAYFLEQNKQHKPAAPKVPPELARFEPEFPGCSLGPFPWPDNPRVVYRLEDMMDPLPTRRISTRVRTDMLIATCGKDTLAYWSAVGVHWVIVCPAYEVLDSPWSAP